MTLNKSVGNMYPWCNYTWNPIRGKCPHECSYCYMKNFKVGELRLDNKALGDDLGKDNVIFVGSSTDMFADAVPKEWIMSVLSRCSQFPENTYLFQTKNPHKFQNFNFLFSRKAMFGTTIETNRQELIESSAPKVSERQYWIRECHELGDVFVGIEPVMDFDLDVMTAWMKDIRPKFISIGADSKGSNLAEPDAQKLRLFIGEMEKLTEVKLKTNLGRLLKGGD